VALELEDRRRLLGEQCASVAVEPDALLVPVPAVTAECASASIGAAFHHLPARLLANLDQPMDCDVLVCADRADAMEETVDPAAVAQIHLMNPEIGGHGPNIRTLDLRVVKIVEIVEDRNFVAGLE